MRVGEIMSMHALVEDNNSAIGDLPTVASLSSVVVILMKTYYLQETF
jgi:hypothetical protein